MRRFAPLALALALGACMSPAQVREQESHTCQGYGFSLGTDQFSHCLMYVDQERQNRRAAAARAAASSSTTCTYGNGMMFCN